MLVASVAFAILLLNNQNEAEYYIILSVIFCL